jgi:hypothetical protein
MRTIFKFLLVFACVSCPLLAQDEAEVPMGFIRIVNAVSAGAGEVHVLIDGADIRPQGYQPGDVTGGIALLAGNHKLSIRREGVRQGSTTVALDADQTVTFVAFAESIPATESEPAHVAVRMLRLKQTDSEGDRTATFVAVSARPELRVELADENGGWTPVLVKRRLVEKVPLKFSQGYAPARVEGGVIKPIPISGKGNYVVVLYDDREARLRSIFYRDLNFGAVQP